MPSLSRDHADGTPTLPPFSRRVVLVEDDLHFRDLLADEIRDVGFDVVELSDGDELLSYFRGAASNYQSTLPDVVVAEVDLPGCSGLEACFQLRKAGALVPFILLSTAGLEGLHEAAVEVGADCVLDKPFRIAALTNALENAARS